MSSIHLVLGDQLSFEISSLKNFDKNKDIVFMCEVFKETSYVKHHKKKIAFLFSAMRHFGQSLIKQGYNLYYKKLDENRDSSFTKELETFLKTHNYSQLVVTHPGEYRVLEEIKTWQKSLGIEVSILEDDRFLSTIGEFASWAKGKKNLRMEFFYREMRKKHNILMDHSEPVGGQYNFDKENRKPPKSGMKFPAIFVEEIDEISQEVIDLVKERFSTHFGDLTPFYFAVTREGALKVLDKFIKERLLYFGDYQDGMLQGEPWMYHSHISFYLNCGLLLPLECVQKVEDAYRNGQAPLNAVEGFIRQIIGWREFVRGIYWLKMPQYKDENFLQAKRRLPDFFWSGNVTMNCLRQVILETKKNAYAHHIQRLMVLGNFALLCGIDPKEVQQWFLSVYADAYEWVELPNVVGMILFADGGFLGSKPYGSSGNYINKMSNYCKKCSYKVSKKEGEDSCPFNYLYWNFLESNREKLGGNHRLGMVYKTYDRMTKERKENIKKDSINFFKSIENETIF